VTNFSVIRSLSPGGNLITVNKYNIISKSKFVFQMTRIYLHLQEVIIGWWSLRTCFVFATFKRVSIKFGINILQPPVTGLLFWISATSLRCAS